MTKKTEKTTKELLENALRIAGVDPDAFDILFNSPFVLQSMDPNMGLACYIAVSKINGMMFFFASETVEKIESKLVKC